MFCCAGWTWTPFMFNEVISRRNVGRFHIYFLIKRNRYNICIYCNLFLFANIIWWIVYNVYCRKNDKTHTIVKRGQCLEKKIIQRISFSTRSSLVKIKEVIILNLINKFLLYHLLSQTLKSKKLINIYIAPNKYGYSIWIIILYNQNFDERRK